MSDRLEAAVAELIAAIRAEIRDELEATPPAPDRLLSIDEARSMLGLGRSALYNEIQERRLHSIKVGRRRLVPAVAIADYIAARAS